ncbi:MAG: hypothetical protein ACYDAE_25270 [Steroidobacteraceae bacterium]
MIFDRARARSGALGALRLWICGAGAALAVALAGCSTSTNISNGTPVVTVTSQAAGDFSTYIVGVTLYSLTRSDGYVSYPAGYTAEEFADLTKQVDLTELLNAVGVPTGTYKSAVIGIDYSLAIVYVKGQSTVATVENTSQANPGIVYVTVNLDPSHQLVVNHNQSTPLALDFDLAASNSISGNTVTVRPFVEAVTPSNDTEQVRARGLFVAANTGASNFIEDLRPFEDNIYSTVGALTVNTTPSTFFNINGKIYTGSAGLSAVAGLPSNEPMVEYGTLDGTPAGSNSTITPSFTATQVYAGIVVSNGSYEHVRGIVSAISGGSLTVQGAQYLYYAGYCVSNLCYTYYPTATVTVGSSTQVMKDGTVPASGTNFSTQSISIGSQIDALGLGSTNSSGALTLDATAGLVRLQSTPIWGTLNAGTASSGTLSLLSMGTVDFPAGSFNFAGTGTSSANDATAAAYAVDTTALGGSGTAGDLSATTAGTLLRIDGFPTSFGAAPPDFEAAAVTLGSSQPADLIVEWPNTGATAPFSSQDSTSLALNLSGNDLAEVVVGPQCAESGATGCAAPTALTGTPTINISTATQFAIGNATNGISVFSTSSAFVTQLSSTFNGTTAAHRVVAIGTYDSATNTFTANRVDVALE